MSIDARSTADDEVESDPVESDPVESDPVESDQVESDQAEGETEADSDTGPDSSNRRPGIRLRGLLAALVVLALVVLVTGLLAWSRAEPDASISYAEARDRVLVEATEAVEVLNTLDHDDLDAGLARWGEVSAGTLHDQLTSLRPEDRKALGATGSASTAQVLDAGLTALDLRAGTATGIFVVEITVQDGTGPAEPKRNRYVGDLVRGDDDQWRFTSLLPVEVSAG